MVDLLIKLAELFRNLVDHRQTRVLTYFREYVQPTYDVAELVFRDYLKLFNDVKRMVRENRQPREIIRFMEDRRGDHLPERERLRALTRERPIEIRACKSGVKHSVWVPRGDRGLRTIQLNRLELGIVLLLRGGVVTPDNPHESPCEGSGSHAILDVLRCFEGAGSKWKRREYLALVDRQIAALMTAWKEVAAGYAELHDRAVPRS